MLQVTDSGVSIASRPAVPTCSFLLPFNGPTPGSTPSSLVWYNCWDNGNLVLTIEGLGSIQDYQQLLRSVTYSNSALEPDIYNLTRNFYVRSPRCMGL